MSAWVARRLRFLMKLAKLSLRVLGTAFWTSAALTTCEPSELLTAKVREYAVQAVHKICRSSPKQVTEGGGLRCWERVISAQATPTCLKNGHALLLFLGQTPSKKANRNSPGFWASESESSRIMQTVLEKCLKWEIAVTDTQERSLTGMIDQGFLPFLNLYPWGNASDEDFEPATDLFRAYLKAVRPLIIVCLGHEVNSYIYDQN
jgi:uracil-DNA glycosylase